MQFRAGALYIILFLVIAAGAYGVIATAESPEISIDSGDADYQLSQGEEFEANGTTYNVSEVGDGQGTLEYVNESAILEQQWENGDSVAIEEGTEYVLVINQPDNESDGDGEGGGEGNESDGEGNESDGEDNESDGSGEGEGGEGNESDGGEGDGAQPQSFTLREDFGEDEYETVDRDDGTYVVVAENDTERLVPIDEFEEIESQTYEVGDTVEFYNSDTEEMVQGEVTEISSETVTVEYEGTEVTEYDLEHAQTVLLEDNTQFAVYFSGDQVLLSSDLEQLEQQEAELETFGDRIEGLWWIIVMSVLSITVIGGLAFMPVRG